MKNFKRFLLGVVFATLVFATCGMSVMAADKTKTLKQNAWFTQKDGAGQVYNKITVPNDGYITITLEKSSKSDSVWIDLYDSKKTYIGEPVYNNTDKKIVKNYPVRKGTYYLKGVSYKNYKYKYKWKFTKAVNKPNYSASKAISLNANKELIVINTPKDSYDRWYKIKLTKKKTIECWITGDDTAYIYDDELDSVEMRYDSDEKSYYSSKKLAKGTYYIRIAADRYFYSKNKINMTTFKWK